MKTITQVLLIFIIGCQSQPPDAIVESNSDAAPHGSQSELESIIDRYMFVSSLLTPDSETEDILREIEIGDLSHDEQLYLSKTLSEFIIDMEHMLHSNPHCSNEDRDAAIARNQRHDFYFDPQIPVTDLNAIIAFMHEFPYFDARIMTIQYIDKDTVSITTGVQRGPLDGGGSNYTLRREGAQWRMVRSNMWVS